MAGIWKHPQSRFWTAIFYDGTGKKIRRTTKLTNQSEARKEADRLEAIAKAGAQGFLAEGQLRKTFQELAVKYLGQEVKLHTVQQWFAEWLQGKTGSIGARSLSKYQQVTREFLEHLGPKKAGASILGVSVKDVTEFRDKLHASGLSASTVNQTVIKVLGAPFLAAQKLGFVQLNPCAAVPALKETKHMGREGFSPADVKKLLSATEGDWIGVILCGYHTSLRLRDITDMEWTSVKPKHLDIRTGKTGAHLLIPMHPDVAAWLKAQPRSGAKVFPSLAGKQTGGQWALSGLFAKIMAKAGVVGKTLRTGKGRGRTTSSLSFHSLRHGSISAMANAGVDREIRKKLSGHADDKSHQIYTHHELQTLQDAIEKVPSVL